MCILEVRLIYYYELFEPRYVTTSYSFVQEFVASPVDGVTLLLEALRALQLSQSASFDKNSPVTNGFRNHAFQRRALLDELACLLVF